MHGNKATLTTQYYNVIYAAGNNDISICRKEQITKKIINEIKLMEIKKNTHKNETSG